MNKKEAAIVSAYTGYLIGDFEDFHKYVEQILQKPVFTHSLPELMNEIHEKSKADFVNIKID